MFIKTTLGLAAALAIASSGVALAQHVDQKASHPVYRSAPAELNYGGVPGGEPKSRGAGHMPEAYYDQQQTGYPQSPPGGGE